jgi:hypothetical protein
MTIQKKTRKPSKTQKRKSRREKGSFILLMRQWFLPLLLLLLVCFSLAATFYLIFLHIPATPVY